MDPAPVLIPTLSICIATFNRANMIGETLDSLLRDIPAGVEIVILDGGSSDATEQVITGYCARFPLIRYLRQATNLGVDRDFDTAVQLARGEYCWLMSDDDLVKPGAIARVLRETLRGYDLIIVNAEARNTDFSEVLIPRLLRFDTDRRYGPEESDRLLSDTGSYLSFIGGVVMRRACWNQRAREPYYGSLFIHVGVIFQAPLASVLAIAEPLVVIRYGNAMWTGRGFEIWMFKWPSLVWSFQGISDAAKRQVSPREPWRRPTALLLFRAKGAYSLAEFRRWLNGAAAPAPVRARAALVALIPGVMAHALVTAYLKLRHPAPAVALFELRHSRFHPFHLLSRARRSVSARPR